VNANCFYLLQLSIKADTYINVMCEQASFSGSGKAGGWENEGRGSVLPPASVMWKKEIMMTSVG